MFVITVVPSYQTGSLQKLHYVRDCFETPLSTVLSCEIMDNSLKSCQLSLTHGGGLERLEGASDRLPLKIAQYA